MRYLGLDYGSKTCGVSVSDPSGIIASSLTVIRYENIASLLCEIEKIIKEKRVEKIVLGNPINMDGSISTRSIETFKFKSELENKFKLEVILQDERLSTVEAHGILKSSMNTRKMKKVVDKVAASIILQTALDRSNNGK